MDLRKEGIRAVFSDFLRRRLEPDGGPLAFAPRAFSPLTFLRWEVARE